MFKDDLKGRGLRKGYEKAKIWVACTRNVFVIIRTGGGGYKNATVFGSFHGRFCRSTIPFHKQKYFCFKIKTFDFDSGLLY